MSRLLADALDLYRFRVKPLPAYYYPWWQLALLVSAIGLVVSGGSPELGSYLPGRVGFCIAYNWLETLLFVPFLGLWLRVSPLRFLRPLLALIALCSGIQLLQPLLSWLPSDVADGLSMVAVFYSLLVLCNALSLVSGMRRLRVVLGVLLFSLASAFLMQSAWSLTSRLGWVAAPASAWNPFAAEAGDAGQAATSPSSSSGSGDAADGQGDRQSLTPAVMP